MHDHLYVFCAAVLAVAVLVAVAAYSHIISTGTVYRAAFHRDEDGGEPTVVARTNALLDDAKATARKGQNDAHLACVIFGVVALVFLWQSGVVRM